MSIWFPDTSSHPLTHYMKSFSTPIFSGGIHRGWWFFDFFIIFPRLRSPTLSVPRSVEEGAFRFRWFVNNNNIEFPARSVHRILTMMMSLMYFTCEEILVSSIRFEKPPHWVWAAPPHHTIPQKVGKRKSECCFDFAFGKPPPHPMTCLAGSCSMCGWKNRKRFVHDCIFPLHSISVTCWLVGVFGLIDSRNYLLFGCLPLEMCFCVFLFI